MIGSVKDSPPVVPGKKIYFKGILESKAHLQTPKYNNGKQ